MRKINLAIALIFLTSIGIYAQPDQWFVTINPAEVNALLNSKRTVGAAKTLDAIVIDGTKDVRWDQALSHDLNKTIKYSTAFKDGSYIKQSMLSDGNNTRRLPENTNDFFATYKTLYDEDYIYIYFDVTDDEINDGVLNPGTTETIEFNIAPYSDSAKQLLGSKPYPPYTGGAGELNKKYCYWGYLGAFQIVFQLNGIGSCNVNIRQKVDALPKINYDQRASSCPCAWKQKADGKGYIAEIGISKIALADSANVPFVMPTADQTKKIAFETKIYDRDLGKKDISTGWNTEDNNVWDAMLWAGYMSLNGNDTIICNDVQIKMDAMNEEYYNTCMSSTEKLKGSPNDIKFWGDGVEDGYFIPAKAKAKSINTIYFGYNDSVCFNYDSLKLYVNGCIDLENLSMNTLSISPNPVSDILTVHLNNNCGKAYSVQIYDAYGRIIYNEINCTENEKQLTVANLASGIYNVKVTQTDKTLFSKFIKL